MHLSCHEAVRELVLLVVPESPSSFGICSGRLLNNSKSLTENIGDSDWSKCQPIKLVIVNSHYFSFWTNLSISYGLTSHCPYSTLKHYFTPTQFISRTFGICRSCDPRMLQSGYSYFKCPLCSCLEVLGMFSLSWSGMYVVCKSSWKDREVGPFLIGKFFPSSFFTWEIVKLVRFN